MSDPAENTEEATEATLSADEEVPVPQPQNIYDFSAGDKIRHVSYPEGVYAEIIDIDDNEQVTFWCYGLDDTPIQAVINEGTGGLGLEWFPYEED